MSATRKKRSTIQFFAEGVTLSDQVKDHSSDPYIVKKIAQARETIKRIGLPGSKKK